MAAPFEVLAGPWVRFDHYVVERHVIRPAPGAVLQPYDPWAEFRRAREDGSVPRPYESLANLCHSLAWVWDEEWRKGLAPEGEAAVLRWCSEYGLLGVLCHKVLSIDLHPLWEADGARVNVLVNTYSRAAGEWERIPYSFYVDRELLPTPSSAFAPIQDSSGLPRAKAIVRSWLGTSVEPLPLAKGLWPFFPGVPAEEAERYEYPLPLTVPFWEQYGEPVHEFVQGAALLDSALGHLSKASEPERTSDYEAAVRILDALVAGVGPTVALDQEHGRLRQVWRCDSLISSLAMMALQDMTEGRRLLECEICGKLFVTDAYQARYCSARCRFTAQKRAYRAKLKKRT